MDDRDGERGSGRFVPVVQHDDDYNIIKLRKDKIG